MSTSSQVDGTGEGLPLVDPGRSFGLIDVFRHRYLLRLLVRQELKIRYHGSVLGLLWSYVRPAVHFTVYYFALGVILRLGDLVENFPVYLFAGLVVVTFFNETFVTATTSILANGALVKKIFLPRELFPMASLAVSVIHLVPQVVVLFIAALVTGWTPSFFAIGSALLGFAIVAVLGMALGLLFAAANVYFRDFQNVTDILTIVITWSVPMIYTWTLLRDNALEAGNGWILDVYLANPLVSAVSLFQKAFWLPGTDQSPETVDLIVPDLWLRGFASLGVALVFLVLAQLAFRRLEGKFAQEL